MSFDTIDAINHYPTDADSQDMHDASKLAMNIAPRAHYNFNSYNAQQLRDESPSRSISGDDEGDYATPVSASMPNSRQESKEDISERGLPATQENMDNEASLPSQIQDLRSIVMPTPQPFLDALEEEVKPPTYSSFPSTLFAGTHSAHTRIETLNVPGTEKLPEYATDIDLSNVFMRKREFINLNMRSSDRSWNRTLLEIRGTHLSMYSCKAPLWNPIPSRPDLTSSVKKGPLTKSYNLAHAEVGVALDYLKKKYVMRLKVEEEQMLLQCTEVETLIDWIEKLGWAIGCALPLEEDEREEVLEVTLPRGRGRRRRRRETVGSSVDVGEEDAGAAGEERLRRHRSIQNSDDEINLADIAPDVPDSSLPSPCLSHAAGPGFGRPMMSYNPHSSVSSFATPPEHSRASTPAPSSHARGERMTIQELHSRYPDLYPNTSPANSRSPTPAPYNSAGPGVVSNYFDAPVRRPAKSHSPPPPSRNGPARYPSTLNTSATDVQTTTEPLVSTSPRRGRTNMKGVSLQNPNLDADGKWAPICTWTLMHDQAWANKCLPVLLSEARRKCPFVVMNGQRYFVKIGPKNKQGIRKKLLEKWAGETFWVLPHECMDTPPSYEEALRK